MTGTAAWVARTDPSSIDVGLDRKEALVLARDLIARLRQGEISPASINIDDDVLDVLNAAVEVIASDGAADAQGALGDASRLHRFILAVDWPESTVSEKADLLRACSFRAWRLARLAGKPDVAGEWARHLAADESLRPKTMHGFSKDLQEVQSAERVLSPPLGARPTDVMEDPEALLAVSASLRDLFESKPLLLKKEAEFIFSVLEQQRRPLGLFDEREYFLGEFALLAGMANRALAHRKESSDWLNVADANFRLTVNAEADGSRVSYHRLALALDERRFNQVFEQLPPLRESFDRLAMAQESLKCRFLEGVALVESGAPESALKIFQEAAADAAKQGNQKLLAAAYGNLVNVHGVMGNTAEAVEASRQALSLLDKVQAREYVAKIQWGIGSLLRTQGRRTESIDAYREAGSHFEQMGMQADLAATRLMIADLYLELGQDSAALREVLFALPIVEEYRLVPEGVAALSLLRESVRQQKVNQQALRDLHGFFEDSVS